MRKLTKILSLAFVFALSLMLAACGTRTEAPTQKPTQPPTQQTQKSTTTTQTTTTATPVEYWENALLKGNFEDLVQPVKNLTGSWVAGWGNWSGAIVEVVTESDGNHALKLRSGADEGAAKATAEMGTGVYKEGHFKVQMDVKKGPEFDGDIVFGLWDNANWLPGWPLAKFDLTNVTLSETQWTTISLEYDCQAATSNSWVNADVGYVNVHASENNYLLIDNFTVLKRQEDGSYAKADINFNNNCEAFDAELILNVSGWKAGSFIWVEADSLENELLTLDGNTVLKVYGTEQKSVKFDLAAGGAIVLPGDYKVTMKVKLGSAASNVSSINFKLYGSPNPVLPEGKEVTNFDLSKLSADGWATIDAYFTLESRVTSAWVNMWIEVVLNNDTIKSTDNYILIDDVEILQAK